MKKTKTIATTVDEFIALAPKETQAALKNLRRIIKSAAPKATEGISYQIAMYKHNGPLVGFAASDKHCSFYIQSPPLMPSLKNSLKEYKISGATVHFQPEKPLPATLVTKIVKARIAENEKAKRT